MASLTPLMINADFQALDFTFLVDITEYMSLFESGISGSLTEETLLLESFLLRL